MDVRRIARGHYSDHGLGGAAMWVPDETRITAPDGEYIVVADTGMGQVAEYHHIGGILRLRREAGVFFEDHDDAVRYWTARFDQFKTGQTGSLDTNA